MNYYLTIALVLFIYMNFWFVISLIKKRNDIADVAWGLGFVLIAWFSLYLNKNINLTTIVVAIAVTIWGIRLATHIYLRNRNKKEDYRYLAWREKWGKYFFVRSYFQVFILQGILLYIISLPVLFINYTKGLSFSYWLVFGILIWTIGFFFESIGDLQLSKFLKNPNNGGKVLNTGLWKYTRHPNYFGEVTEWWGLWLVAISISGGWLTIFGPLTITFLILKVSGIPLLESKMSENPEYIEYKKKTSLFIPFFPKK